jgi:prepilin-type N-terminal cleavage/methylation domain-containing protein
LTHLNPKRGFSLPELIVGLLIAALIITMGMLNTRSATETAEARGLAEELTEELKSARRLAVTKRQPVAVGFATGGGSTPHFQSFYLLEGHDKPRITGGRRFQGEYPDAHAFVGYWTVTGGHSNTRDPILFDGNGSDFDVTAWQVPYPTDYLFIFLPSGHLTTNGVPNYDGQYHILVSEGVGVSGAGPPSGSFVSSLSYFQPTEVSSVHTISLSSGGGISMRPGVPDGIVSTSPDSIPTGTPPPPPLPTGGNSDPVLLKVSSEPRPVEAPAGMDAVVPPGGYLTLRLQVAEPDGHPPLCKWTATDGSFSSKEPTRMEWDSQVAAWVSEWVWTPPEGSVDGTVFDLEFEVTDGHGGVLIGQLGASGKVVVGQDGLICFTSTQPDGSQEIGIIHPDGIDMRLATPSGDSHDNRFPSWSPGGNQIACYGENLDDPTVFESLYVVNRDGSGLKAVHTLTTTDDYFFQPYDYGLNDYGPDWSPDGTRLTYAVYDFDNWSSGIWVVNADGSGLAQLTSPAADVEDFNPKWSPNGNKIVFHRDNWNNDRCNVFVMNANGSGRTKLTSAGVDTYNFDPDFNDTGNKIVYVHETWTQDQLKVMNANGSNKTTVLNDVFAESPRFSPDGNLIAFTDTHLYVTTLNGKNPHSGADGARKISDNGYIVDFQWSPSGDRLVYSDGKTMYQANVIGVIDRRRVSTSSSAEDFVVSWSK